MGFVAVPGTASEIDEDVFADVDQFHTSQNNLTTSFRKTVPDTGVLWKEKKPCQKG
jgi:hypothetical protein